MLVLLTGATRTGFIATDLAMLAYHRSLHGGDFAFRLRRLLALHRRMQVLHRLLSSILRLERIDVLNRLDANTRQQSDYLVLDRI